MTLANRQLSEKCEQMASELEQALEVNEKQRHEKVAWEMALKQASKEQANKDKRQMKQRREMEVDIEEKTAKITSL